MNSLIVQLDNIGALNKDRLVEYYPKVRDRNDISVLIDPITEVIVLSQCDHVNKEYYRDRKEDGNTIGNSTYISPKLNDNSCRSNKYYEKIYNKCWLDFGCGNGGMLDELSSVASECFGLDPNKDRQLIARSKGHNVVSSLKEISDGSLDVVTMFHVLEHLTDPISTLNSIKQKLKPGGEIIIEVPHARDALFTLYDSEPFRKFTFWSEHLILHTRSSLRIMLEASNFSNCEIKSHQRYPLANHLYWLSRNKPGGQSKWNFLLSDALNNEYDATLSMIDRTDTIVAFSKC